MRGCLSAICDGFWSTSEKFSKSKHYPVIEKLRHYVFYFQLPLKKYKKDEHRPWNLA